MNSGIVLVETDGLTSMTRECAPAASDRLAPRRNATRPAARQRPPPDAENFGAEVSFPPPTRFTSFDHLVGEREQLWRDFEAEPLGGDQIEDEIELARLLNRNVARLRPAQNFVHIVGGAPK